MDHDPVRAVSARMHGHRCGPACESFASFVRNRPNDAMSMKHSACYVHLENLDLTAQSHAGSASRLAYYARELDRGTGLDTAQGHYELRRRHPRVDSFPACPMSFQRRLGATKFATPITTLFRSRYDQALTWAHLGNVDIPVPTMAGHSDVCFAGGHVGGSSAALYYITTKRASFFPVLFSHDKYVQRAQWTCARRSGRANPAVFKTFGASRNPVSVSLALEML